jgi:hypothetical protein
LLVATKSKNMGLSQASSKSLQEEAKCCEQEEKQNVKTFAIV